MKVLLVDDHPLILSALQSVIQGLGDDVTVVGVETARGGARRRCATTPTSTSCCSTWRWARSTASRC